MDTLCSAICALYCAVIILFSAIHYVDSILITIPIFTLLFILFSRLDFSKIIGWLENILLNHEQRGGHISFFIAAAIIIFSCHLIYWLGHYPGGFNLDALGQWDQIHGVQGFFDWHPVMNTLLYWLLTRVSDSLSFCIFFQITVFSLVTSLFLTRLRLLGVRSNIALGLALFIGANPAIALCNVSMTKDVFFTVFTVSLYICTLDIYTQKGVPLDRLGGRLAISFLLLMITLMRHNGMLLTGSYLLLLFVFYGRNHMRSLVWVVAIFTVGFTLVKGCLYPLLDVQPHENVIGEAAGVPMAIMANALVHGGDNCPDEVREFLNEIADDAQWEEHYFVGEWDSCKWDFGGTELLKGESPQRLLSLMYKAIKACPQEAYISLVQNTRVMWQVVGVPYWDPLVYVAESEYGIKEHPVPACRAISDTITELSLHIPVIQWLLWNVGLYILIILLLTLAIVKKRQWDKLLFIIPLLLYTWGTTCLLCGPSFRYFYLILVLAPPLLTILVMDRPHPGNEKGIGVADQI